jgi:polar amino acid transport system permease protein
MRAIMRAFRTNHVLSFFVALVVLAAIVVGALLALRYHWSWAGVWKYRTLFVQGWLSTLTIAAVALPLATLFGLVLALARRAPWLPLRYIARIYVETARGTPLLVQIYLYFYVFGQALPSKLYVFGYEYDPRIVIGPLIMAVFSGAYISEIIRGGLESVGRSQLESARAIGLTTPQTYRYVIFPQAIRQILPGLAGQFVSLVKDSSLLSIIALNEFTKAGENVNAYTVSPFESYIPVAIGYLLITIPISLWTQRLEQRTRFET